MTDAKQIPVPKLLWDELENVMMTKSKELIQEIAKVLRQDPNILWKEFRSKKSNLFLVDIDHDTDEHQCMALVSTTKVAHRCRKPTLFGKPYCPEHEFFTLTQELKTKPQLQRLSCSEEPLFVDCLTQQVYNLHYERVGYIQGEQCILFEIEEG